MGEAESHLPLHPLAFRILLSLLEGPRHGYDIVRAIEAEGVHGRIYPANLYRRIRDLVAAEVVEEVAGEVADGTHARRRYLRITRSGRAVAKAEARRLQQLVADPRVHTLLHPSR